MPTNQQIINKAGTAIQTGSLTHGLLQPEQARKFIQQTFEATNLGPLVRHVMRTSKSGEIDRLVSHPEFFVPRSRTQMMATELV